MLQNTDILKHSKLLLNPNYYLNPRAKTFIPISIAQPYVFVNTLVLSPHANDFMIQVILVFILIIKFLVCSILNITGIQYGDELAPKNLVRKLKFDNPNKLIIGNLTINSIRY